MNNKTYSQSLREILPIILSIGAIIGICMNSVDYEELKKEQKWQGVLIDRLDLKTHYQRPEANHEKVNAHVIAPSDSFRVNKIPFRVNKIRLGTSTTEFQDTTKGRIITFNNKHIRFVRTASEIRLYELRAQAFIWIGLRKGAYGVRIVDSNDSTMP